MYKFEDFVTELQLLLDGDATVKKYNTTGIDGKNELFDFVSGISGDGHALGEIIYKVKRYAAKGDPKDIAKVAAWAFLVWRAAMVRVRTDFTPNPG